MRTRFGVVVLGALVLPFLQCSGGDDSAPAQSANDAGGDATGPSDSGPIVDAAPIDSGPPIVTVSGTLMGRATDGGPLASRDVVIVDANGVVAKTTTDANGNFGAPNVQTPYDIGIPYVPLDAASAAYPHFYAGISRANPIVRGVDYTTAIGVAKPPQATTLSFTADVCAGCQIQYAGPDQGSGTSGSGGPQLFTLPYNWNGNAVYSVPLHFYILNAGAFMSYVDVPSTALTAGGTTNLGTLTFAPASNGTISVATTIPADYTLGTTAFRPTAADGSKLVGGNFSIASGVFNFPKLAGISVEIDNQAYGPDGIQTSATVTYAEATTPATLAIDLLAAPTELLPANHATGVTDSESLTWSAFGRPVPYQIFLTSPNGNGYLIYTAATSVSLSALAKAGVPLEAGTTFTWQLAADGYYASMDDLTTSRAQLLPATLQGDAEATTQTFTTQ